MYKAKAVHCHNIKENNKLLVRNLLRGKECLSKSEIAGITSLSFPTVSSAINELMETGEVIENTFKSTGGRPSSYYGINPEYKTIVCLSNIEYSMYVKIYDYNGIIKKEYETKDDENYEVSDFIRLIKDIKSEYSNISDIFWAIPGISKDGIIYHYPHLANLEGKDISSTVRDELGIELHIENDVNMIAMAEVERYHTFAHILWIMDCIGSAIILDGQIVKGDHGCGGEIEYACYDFSDRVKCLVQAVRGITAVLDLHSIIFSGPDLKKEDVDKVRDEINKIFAPFRRPELIYSEFSVEAQFKGIWKVAEDYFGKSI